MTEPHMPLELNYEPVPVIEPIGRRPKWVWTIMGIYLLLLLGVLLLPAWGLFDPDFGNDLLVPASITAFLVTLSGLGLVMTPVRIARRRPITRRGIWVPLIASGFLIGSLVAGAGFAMTEFFRGEDEWLWGAMIGGGLVWVGWTIVIWRITARRVPDAVAIQLHRAVFAGSVAELLVAVPMHIVVRRREECCAGYVTASAIAIGCVVMFISLGPSVAFLYYRRWKQITGG